MTQREVDTNEFECYADMLPEGAIPMNGVRIIRFVDEEGDVSTHFHCSGMSRLVDTLGMLEWAKLHLYITATNDTDEDDQEDESDGV